MSALLRPPISAPLLLPALILLPATPPLQSVRADDAPPPVSAEAAALADSRTGRILWSKNPRRRMHIASLTKIMTAYVAIKHGDLDAVVSVSSNAADAGGSGVGLGKGQRLPLRKLVMAALVYSANDAATALSETVFADPDAFIATMNTQAKHWGAEDTRYRNPHGLDEDGHYSTARDQALIAVHAMESPVFRQIVAKKEFTIHVPAPPPDTDAGDPKQDPPSQPGAERLVPRTLSARNRLLNQWELCDGIKTGYTRQAGHCLAASATHRGWRAIVVLLNAPKRWQDAKKLLQWAFETYRLRKVVDPKRDNWQLRVHDGKPDTITVAPSQDVQLLLKRGADVQRVIEPAVLEPPLKRGKDVATLHVICDGKRRVTAPLVARRSAEMTLWGAVKRLPVPQYVHNALLCIAVGVLMFGTVAKVAGTRGSGIPQSQ